MIFFTVIGLLLTAYMGIGVAFILLWCLCTWERLPHWLEWIPVAAFWPAYLYDILRE